MLNLHFRAAVNSEKEGLPVVRPPSGSPSLSSCSFQGHLPDLPTSAPLPLNHDTAPTKPRTFARAAPSA